MKSSMNYYHHRRHHHHHRHLFSLHSLSSGDSYHLFFINVFTGWGYEEKYNSFDLI